MNNKAKEDREECLQKISDLNVNRALGIKKCNDDRLGNENVILRSQIQVLENSTDEKTFNQSILIGRLEAKERKLNGSEKEQDEKRNKRREISQQIDMNIKSACKSINDHLRRIIRDINSENNAYTRVKRSPVEGVNFLWNFMNYMDIQDAHNVISGEIEY